MRRLPCDFCRDGEAWLPPNKRFPNGEPYVCGRLSSEPLLVPCARCLRTTKVTAGRWNMLPELTLEDLRALGFELEARSE